MKKEDSISKMFGKMHKKWQTTVIKNLKSAGKDEIVEILN